ncbi:MAG TPA: hypothetical protein VKJ07_05080, partial [Mycobacteriales bacterium]|nr:hypothetical protein [Mycobacteriales bacterium]
MSLAGDPVDPAIVYAGTFQGGFFRTTDGGANWVAANDGLDTLFVPSVVADPQTPGTIYATGGIGIYKSVNGGTTWTRTHDAAGVQLVVDPVSPSTIYAATSAGVNGFGVLRSNDGAGTWTQMNIGLPATNVGMSALAIDPSVPSVLYAAFLDQTTYITTDAAAHWTPITGPFATHDVLSLAVDSRSVVYVGTNFGSYFSSDHGATWTLARLGVSNVGSAIVVDPRQPSVVYGAGAGDLLQSVDGGVTWTQLDLAAATTIAAAPGGPIFAGTSENGALKSGGVVNGILQWSAVNHGMRASIADGVALAPGSSSKVFAATAGHVAVSDDGGASWTESDVLDAESIALDPQSPSTIYVSGANGAQKSVDGGKTWKGIQPVVGDAMTSMAIAPDAPATLYFGTQ